MVAPERCVLVLVLFFFICLFPEQIKVWPTGQGEEVHLPDADRGTDRHLLSAPERMEVGFGQRQLLSKSSTLLSGTGPESN